MKDVRIGNDISVIWSLYSDQKPFLLDGLKISVYLKGMYGKTKIEDYTIKDNEIHWTFFGKDQKHTGKYSLTLVVNEGAEGMVTTDVCDLVRLVSCTCQADGSDEDGVQTETIAVNSEVELLSGGVGRIDTALDPMSENAVSNAVITAEFGKVNEATSGLKTQMADDKAELMTNLEQVGVLAYEASMRSSRNEQDIAALQEKDKETDTKLTELSTTIEPFEGDVETLSFNYTEMQRGAISFGAIQTFGFRTEPIAVKKGDYIVAKGFNGTPAYDFASEWNNGNYVQILYRPTGYGEQDFTLVVDADKSIVFSTSSDDIIISIHSNDVLRAIGEIEPIKEELNQKPNKKDFNFFGFAVDETTNIYEYYRRINLPNYTLKKGACFALQMGAKLYDGYGDDERTLVLDVSETGAKPFLLDGIEYGAKYSWEQGDMLFVYYDGEAYQATGFFGQSKANAVWGDVIGATFRDLFAESEPIDSGIQWYKACKVSVKKGEVIFICTESTPGVNIISQILPNGEIKVLEHGTTSYSGYRIGEYGYIYEVQEDMTIKIIYRSNNKPKIIAIESYLTYFIDKALYAIKEVDKKATIKELNTKASAADLAIETTKREQDINRLQQEIDNLDFSGDIEQVVKDYIAEHPESVTSIQDNSITEAKFTDDVRKKKASYYPNVAAMVADTTLEIGMTAITKGYYAENDGGAGQYTIVARQTENGGSYISLNNGLTASLNFDGKTYILSQWGVRGDGVSRTARSVFPFLTSSAIKSVNPYFDDSVTDATYMIQYLLNLSEYRDYEVVVDGREYKISHTIFLRSMVTLKGVEDGAPRSSWIDALSAVGTYCKSSLIMQKAGIPMFSSDKYFDEGEYSIIQLFAMKNLNARGTFGNNDIDGDAGNFLDGKNMVIIKCLFKNMNIAGFATGFKMVDECIWTNFDGLHIFNMRDNGIDFVYGNSTSGSTGQKNANSITGCIIYSCGRDYDKATGQYINRYGATAGQANRLPIDKPTPSRGNCIVVSYSGNYISNCDISDASVGVYRSAYSDGTTIVGLYSEEISMAQIYNDYTEGNTNSAELGGYLRADQWTDSKGNVHQNKRVANPNDFVA